MKHSLKVLKAHKGPCPKILVMGTHKDCPPQRLEISELKTCLDQFYASVVQFGSEPIVLMNCLSCKDDIKSMLDNVRKEIMYALPNVAIETTPIALFF